MITVYKYVLQRQHRQIVQLPKKAIIRDVAFQGNVLCLWAEVDTDQVIRDRAIHIYGTGHELMDDDLIYLGTAHLNVLDSSLVYHVYENPACPPPNAPGSAQPAMTKQEKLARYFRLGRGWWRVRFGLCPACNSDAPESDSCRVCRSYRTPFPPDKPVRELWWELFKRRNSSTPPSP